MYVLTASCVRFYCVFVYHQFENKLSQTTEKLQEEATQRQQLSEEFEQVTAVFSLVTKEDYLKKLCE